MSDLVENLISLILDLRSKGILSQKDVDTIAVYTDASKASLSERFVQLVRSSELNLGTASNTWKMEVLDRLLNFHELHLLVPIAPSEEIDELIPTFKLKSNDKKRVILLCAQMRKIVFASEVFDQPHRKLLLQRIAAIEKQIEQPKGMLDVIRGGVSDFGETLGKFGVDIKPLTDRINEVMQITRAGSKEYEKLPAPEERKQLPKPTDEEKAEGK
ncbi:MAG: hypothetical protein GQ535_01635 [Rhodobacteraceae bacterium]|nr:hypothetical protein [Paracoccaceae bacterium]